MQATTKAILATNAGRDPERLRLKLQALRSEPFSFFRGTAPLFYTTLQMPGALLAAPGVLACGDLHLENFGSYKGDNRLVYFDLNDFDEACVAPLTFELVRFMASILVAAKYLKIGSKQANNLVANFVNTYAATLATTKPRWVERATAAGPVKTLLQSLRKRHRCDLIARRTVVKKGRTQLIIDGIHALAASAGDRTRATSILSVYASTQANPAHFAPVDIARRIAGNGSLGLERYVVLVRGDGRKDGRYLLDIKIASPSALAACLQTRQPAWTNEAERVATHQAICQAISPALLGAIGAGKRSYVVKELQPTADRVNLQALNGKTGKLEAVIQTMAQVAAWAHLRGASRLGAGGVDALSAYALDGRWKTAVTETAAAAAKLAMQQWQAYAADYDSGQVDRVSALEKIIVDRLHPAKRQ